MTHPTPPGTADQARLTADAVTAPAARSHQDANVVAGKLARLQEPHIAPVTELVERIRHHVGHDQVPYVDPTFGGVRAKVLFLLETPARAAALGSAMLSPDNDDTTAANVWQLYREYGLRRDAAIHWNAVPWFMGDANRNKNAQRSDIVPGLPWLASMIDLLLDLRLVVAMGGIARQAFALYLLRDDARRLPWLAVAHPSPRVRNTNPASWNDTRAAFAKAATVSGIA
jgi:uracil-DNA glycosylase